MMEIEEENEEEKEVENNKSKKQKNKIVNKITDGEITQFTCNICHLSYSTQNELTVHLHSKTHKSTLKQSDEDRKKNNKKQKIKEMKVHENRLNEINDVKGIADASIELYSGTSWNDYDLNTFLVSQLIKYLYIYYNLFYTFYYYYYII